MRTHVSKLKHRKGAWFTPLRGSYIPVAWQGWLTYIPFVAYLVFVGIATYRYAHGVVQTILWAIPNWMVAAIIMTWIAKRKS